MTNNDQNTKEGIQTEDKTMPVRSDLSRHQFRELLTFLTIIKPNFSDFSIVQGQFRSRDNNNLSIVEAHFDYLDQMDFVLWDIKSIAKNLAYLDKAAKITVTVDDSLVAFSDSSRAISIANHGKEDSSNHFIATEEMNGIWYDQIDSDQLFLKEVLPQIVVSRLYKVTHKSHEPAVILKHEDGNLNKGKLFIEHQTGYAAELEWVYTNSKPIDFLIPMKKGGIIQIPCVSYAFNKSYTLLEIYLCRAPGSVGIRHSSRVGILPVVTYSKSLYVGEEDRLCLDDSST